MKKKYLLVLLIIICSIILVKAASYPKGDVDGNNKVAVNDYVLIRKHLLQMSILSGDRLTRADVNRDGKVSSKDYIAIRKIILYGPEEEEIKTYTLTYKPNGGSGSDIIQSISENTDWKTKGVTYTREGYTQVGWSTSPTGSTTHNLDKGQGKWTETSNLVLYAVWSKDSTLVLPEDYVIPSKYTLYQEYSSPTLKYKTMKNNNSYKYYALVWVKDAYHQLNSANSELTSQRRIVHLNNEINIMGYKNKGMIATNGSFTVAGRSNSPVIATKGVYTVNDLYRSRLEDGRSAAYTILTMGSDGNLKIFDTTSATEETNWLNSVEGRNTWTIIYYRTGDWNYDSWPEIDFRTGICQIDKHNFVLFVGYSGISGYMKELHDEFGCVRVANLDGGGSSGMYYKNNIQNSFNKVYEVNKDDRIIADMLYFVEQ